MISQTAAPPKTAPGRLARVVRGRLVKPIRVVLYSTDGLGKSTWASNAPAPIFVGAEDGTSQLDVERMPDVSTWSDIIESMDELAQTDHGYQSVVLDTADWAEPLCWEHVAKAAKKPDIESLPYGKGYVAALDQWRLLLAKLERLRNSKNMHIIILAHVWVKTFKNPEVAGDYDRYEMKLHPKASGLLREWADCVLFGNYETFTDDNNGRVRGVSTGARIVHTQRTAAWDAKNRYDLPESMPLDWASFYEAVQSHQPGDPNKIRARINEMLALVEDPELKVKVEKAVADAGDDAAKLAKYKDTLTARLNIKAQENAS